MEENKKQFTKDELNSIYYLLNCVRYDRAVEFCSIHIEVINKLCEKCWQLMK